MADNFRYRASTRDDGGAEHFVYRSVERYLSRKKVKTNWVRDRSNKNLPGVDAREFRVHVK